MSDLPTALTVAEVATQLNVCHKTIYRWVASGELPAIRVGRTLRFHPDVIETWMRASP